MKRIKFYACPNCGSIVNSTGDAEISCCGRKLAPLIANPIDGEHEVTIAEVDGEHYVTLQHEMRKEHYISFAAYVTYDSMHLVKLYPEQEAEIHLPRMRRGTLYLFCSQHGLWQKKL